MFMTFAIFTVLSTLASAYSSIQQGRAAQRAAKYQAEVQAQNAQLAEQQARSAKTRAESDKLALRLDAVRKTAQGRAGFAAGNVQLGSGTPVDWETDLREATQYDLDTIDYNADLEAWGYRVQGQNAMAESRLSRLQGRNAATAGWLGAATSLLSGAGSVAGTYYMGTER